MNLSEPPLVSIIVPDTGRPGLAMALDSIARQNYPSIEMVIVGATSGGDPLPSLAQARGHIVRTVRGDRQLTGAHAANIGLLAARGEWLCFVDDDGTYDPHFLSAMVEAAGDHPEALLVYGRTRIVRANGQVDRLFGRPFNRLLMHHGPLFHWQSTLIRRRVVELGCRFDEALETCEHHDFLAQIAEHHDFLAQVAEHSDFAFVPVIGFNYRPHRGTSGTASASQDIAKATRFERLLRAKAAGAFAYHTWRAARLLMRADSAYSAGDRTRSRDLFEALLHQYPDDPRALHGLARIELEQGLLDHAETLVNQAVDINPSTTQYRLTRALILERLGRRQDAVQEAALAAKDPTLRVTAEELLRRLGRVDATHGPEDGAARIETSMVPRLGRCPCGSGKRYEWCCGRSAEPAPSKADRLVQRARICFVRGEALRANRIINSLEPAAVGNAELALTAGKICLELRSLERAFAFLDRSAKLEPSAEAGALLTTCCDLLWKDRARASAHAMVLRLRERIEKCASAHRSPTPGPIHVLGTFGTIGGSETRAASLYRTLSGHADVRLWSTVPPLERQYPGLPIQVLEPARGAFPSGGTLVLAGHYFDPGDWWREVTFDRVVICVNLDGPLDLVYRLTDIEECPQVARIDFTFPSHLSRDIFGLPGHIEYSFADLSRFTRTAPRHTEGNRLDIGRHSRDIRLKHHPNDPALYRHLVARGHRLRVLGGTYLQPAFSDDPAAAAVELLAAGSEEPRDFLSGLDCFVYRKHPLFLETGGSAIVEAMAMALPVVVFRDGVGGAELIEHGEDGFLVDTEAEALACIDRLAADPGLRESIGSAARRKVVAIMQDQRKRTIAYYLGGAIPATDSPAGIR